MPAKVSVPDSLKPLLHRFRPCFTAPGYEVFTAMFIGFILRPVERTVCGMLTGAGLAGVWHHSRAHRFFSRTRWDVREVGLILADLVVKLLLPPDAPIQLAIDETLTRRRGPKVFAASWWHDGSAAGTKKIGYGNSWVVLAIVVTLPFCRRPIALPILFALCVKGGLQLLEREVKRALSFLLEHINVELKIARRFIIRNAPVHYYLRAVDRQDRLPERLLAEEDALHLGVLVFEREKIVAGAGLRDV